MGWWRRNAWWCVGGAGAVVAAGLLVRLVVGSESPMQTGDQVASMVGGTMAVLGFPLAVASLWVALRPARIAPAVSPDRAAEDLARVVGRQWEREGRARGLFRPEPLSVRWSTTGRPVAPEPAEVIGPSEVGRITRLRLHGDVTEVAAGLRELPRRQLVVIGPPGSGKTSLAVVLVRDLIQGRTPQDPVPVLLNLIGWRATEEHLYAWLTRELRDQYPFLQSAATILVERGGILPVLDGLDEMPAEFRAAAIEAITEAVGADRPVVVTCRALEYEEVIARTGTPLARAAVVEIEPIAAAEVARYLRAGQVDGERRWQPVVTHLAAEPDGVLAETLSTPLMAYLARTAYTVPATNPAKLLDFGTAEKLADHLLTAYLPGIYQDRPPRLAGDDQVPLRRYASVDAERWLTFLAQRLSAAGDTDLAWWRLIRLATAGPGVTTAAEITDDAVTEPPLRERLFIELARRAGREPVPARLAFRPLRFVIAYLAVMLSTTVVMVNVIDVESRIASTFPADYLVGVVVGTGWAIPIAVACSFYRPVAQSTLADPLTSLRADRLASLSMVVLTVLAIALPAIAGPVFGFLNGREAAELLLSGLIAGLLVFLLSTLRVGWPRYVLTSFMISEDGLLPFPLMTFLEDAYHRGVLRKVGAVYQFRHLRLQQHLAERR